METGATASPRVAIVSTVKARLSVLRPWLEYHRRTGIEHAILFFDDPRDTAADVLESCHAVTAVRCTDAYWSTVDGGRPANVPPRQVVNVQNGMSMAREMGFDWVAHVDCDELIRPLMPIEALLATTDADALKLEMMEAVSERLDYPDIFEPRLFKRAPGRVRAGAARLLGCFRAFRYGEYFRGHTESKCLVRLAGGVLKMGVHKPLEWTDEPRLNHTTEIQLLHFDGVGFADWDAKWSARADSNFGLRPARRRQLEAYRKAAASGRAARIELFRKSQMIPHREQMVLGWLGLLQTIVLDAGSKRV